MAVAAIITADIVNSTLLDPASVKKMISQLSVVLGDNNIEFYRGDSFQAYIKNPAMALELICQVRTIARSFHNSCDIRASIGIGEVKPNVRLLSTANSSAFILSGRAFDELNKDQLLLIRSEDEKANISFDIIAYFADHILQRLTVKQAEVVFQLLNKRTQTQVSKKLKKAQATINQLAKSAEWDGIEKLIESYKQVIVQFNIV